MKKLMVAMIAMGLVAGSGFAGIDADPQVLHTGDHTFREKLDATGKFMLDGTQVTATAAELNQLDADNAASGLNSDRLIGVTAPYNGLDLVGTPNYSSVYFEDFFSFVNKTNEWLLVGDDVTKMTVVAGLGGMMQFLTGATSNNECYASLGNVGTEAFINITSNSTKTVYYETRIKGPAASVNAAAFHGVAAVNANAANFITDSTGALADKSYIGFYRLANSNSWDFAVRLEGQSALVATNVAPVQATYQRLGFAFDGVNTLTIYVDGTANAKTFTWNAASYPNNIGLTPMFGAKSIANGYSPTNHIDYIYVNMER